MTSDMDSACLGSAKLSTLSRVFVRVNACMMSPRTWTAHVCTQPSFRLSPESLSGWTFSKRLTRNCCRQAIELPEEHVHTKLQTANLFHKQQGTSKVNNIFATSHGSFSNVTIKPSEPMNF
jgi:hypothetical protein